MCERCERNTREATLQPERLEVRKLDASEAADMLRPPAPIVVMELTPTVARMLGLEVGDVE